MKKYFSAILPSFATFLAFLILPLAFGIFFVLTRYSDQFIQTQGLDYFAIQNNVLALFFISGSLSEWFTRFMDFAFWGVLASIGLLIAWGVSVAKTSVQNHKTEQGFVNFGTTKESWHGHFVVVAFVKIILIIIMIYSVFSFLSRGIPQLAAGIGACVKLFNLASLKEAAAGVLIMILLQTLFVVSFKTYKHVHAE